MLQIDSHVHFYDPSRPEGLVWPEPDHCRVGGAMPLAYRTEVKSFERCVAIETSRRPQDDGWLLKLADEQSLVQGVVLNLQPDDEDFESRFLEAMENRKFCGIRLRPITCYDLDCGRLLANLEQVADMQKSIEFGATNELLLEKFADLAQRLPNANLLLTHTGHPHKAESRAHWEKGLERIAMQPNAFVKISEILGSRKVVAGRLSTVFRLFGRERVLFGSNWPVSAIAPDTYRELIQELAGDDGAKIAGENVFRAYRLPPV